MPSFAALFRLLLLGLLILGLALPAMAATPDRPAPVALHACPDAPAAEDLAGAAPAAPKENCRQHCLATTLLPAAVAPAMAWGKATPLQPLPLVEAAPSLSPQPEGHPPRL
ncbi:hypothetical protein [Xinfangfangia pollutisoli]|uniref:hypothetical protein n=1 Tax=Xinfangfangia pollutisoli TaxID=2865960 RepID=UPI001CD54087|nr:hypothetical protein [Xinfangfangia pollutisoli]